MRLNAFPRSRRLKRRRLIRPLFDRGRDDVGRVRQGTVMVLYRTVPRQATGLEVGVQVGFAPGRRATNAVRTQVRRFLRETFRQHQSGVLNQFGAREDCLTMMVLYRGRDDGASVAIRRDLPRALDRLTEREIPTAPRAATAP